MASSELTRSSNRLWLRIGTLEVAAAVVVEGLASAVSLTIDRGAIRRRVRGVRVPDRDGPVSDPVDARPCVTLTRLRGSSATYTFPSR
jgi:hypothetical protein